MSFKLDNSISSIEIKIAPSSANNLCNSFRRGYIMQSHLSCRLRSSLSLPTTCPKGTSRSVPTRSQQEPVRPGGLLKPDSPQIPSPLVVPRKPRQPYNNPGASEASAPKDIFRRPSANSFSAMSANPILGPTSTRGRKPSVNCRTRFDTMFTRSCWFGSTFNASSRKMLFIS